MSESLEALKIKLRNMEKFSESWIGKLYNKIFPGSIDKKIQSIQLTIDYINLLSNI